VRQPAPRWHDIGQAYSTDDCTDVTTASLLGGAAGGVTTELPAPSPVLRTLVRIGKFTLEAAALVFLVLLFFIRVPQVSGHSMEPQLRADEHVLINTLAYGLRVGDGARPLVDIAFRPIAHGDVVAFVHSDGDARAVYVKRVIGVPGDAIAIDRGVVRVNGRTLDEPYVNSRDATGMRSTTVPAGAVFVLGDNRRESDDSRAFGAVPESAVIGRAALVVWPLNRAGPIR